ncbi:MAG: 30S ribosomal protein S7 [Dehalococcoidaceae bacterium]|nr:30S ribosomal protein S7 [Dehalococcoidaceae bacterium]
MPRRAQIKKRQLLPDAKYGSLLVALLINKLMYGGKKSVAEKVVYGAMDILEEKESKEPLSVMEAAFTNVTPLVEVRPRRVGGATYQVPVEVRQGRNTSLAMRWILKASRSRSGHSMAEKLAAELLDAYKGQGAAVKKREETHKMAEANRAFAHYRW